MWNASAGLTFSWDVRLWIPALSRCLIKKFCTVVCGAVIKIRLKGNRSPRIRNQADQARSRARNRIPTSPSLLLRVAYNQSPTAKRINSEVGTTLCFLTVDERKHARGEKKNKKTCLFNGTCLSCQASSSRPAWVGCWVVLDYCSAGWREKSESGDRAKSFSLLPWILASIMARIVFPTFAQLYSHLPQCSGDAA